MSKMDLHDSFEHLKHKLWPKKGSGVKLVIWPPTTKSWKSTQFPCVQVACDILLKRSWRGLQLFCRPHLIGSLHTKLWGPKVAGVPTLGISKLPFGNPDTKCHLNVSLVDKHKGEGGGFPQVQAMVNLMSLNCMWLVLAPKVLQLCTNHLMLVLCRSVRIVDTCHSS
jgi:hypothetical protein